MIKFAFLSQEPKNFSIEIEKSFQGGSSIIVENRNDHIGDGELCILCMVLEVREVYNMRVASWGVCWKAREVDVLHLV